MSNPELSLQLYTVREALSNDLDGTLERVAEIGLTNVEAFGFVGNGARLRTAFDNAGLKAPSGHANFLSDTLVFGDTVIDVPSIDTCLDEAATVGIEILIDPMVLPHRWLTRDEIEKTADRMNSYVDRAAERGIRLGYHNHSQEFHHTFDDVSALEFFAQRLDDRVVLEVDVFWASVAGNDPAQLLTRLGDRVRLLHMKDGFPGEDPFRTGDLANMVLDQRVVGEGALDIPAILAAAPAAEYAAIEFDQFNGNLFDAIAASAVALRGAGVR